MKSFRTRWIYCIPRHKQMPGAWKGCSFQQVLLNLETQGPLSRSMCPLLRPQQMQALSEILNTYFEWIMSLVSCIAVHLSTASSVRVFEYKPWTLITDISNSLGGMTFSYVFYQDGRKGMCLFVNMRIKDRTIISVEPVLNVFSDLAAARNSRMKTILSNQQRRISCCCLKFILIGWDFMHLSRRFACCYVTPCYINGYQTSETAPRCLSKSSKPKKVYRGATSLLTTALGVQSKIGLLMEWRIKRINPWLRQKWACLLFIC